MASINLFLGGDKTASGSFALPSVPGTVVNGRTGRQSYADHQRARAYTLTRDLDFRDPAPFGGQGVSHGLNSWYNENFASLVVTDVLRTHLLLPNTVLKWIAIGVVTPVTGLTADVGVQGTSFVELPAVDLGVAAVNFFEFPVGSRRITAVDYVGMELSAIPVGGFKDLVAWISIGVEDLYNGNAGA